MWLTELWLYTTSQADDDHSDDSDVILRVGYLQENSGWREWTFPLDRAHHDDRKRDRTDFYRLVFGEDDAHRAEPPSEAGRLLEREDWASEEFLERPAGPWLGDTTSLPDARAELARLLITLECRDPDRWSLRHYTLVAQVSYIDELPAHGSPKRAFRMLSAKTLLSHGEHLGPRPRDGHDHRGIDLLRGLEDERSLLILTPNTGRFVIVTPEGAESAKA